MKINKVAVTSYIIVILFTYLLLIGSDWVLRGYTIYIAQKANAEATTKENDYAEKTKNEKDKAIKEGYTFSLYPKLFDDVPFVELAKKYNIAPLAPTPNTKIYTGDEGYGMIEYQTDRFGFRNPDDVWDKPVDITIIGDSFAQASNIQEEYSFAGLLRKNFSVLNIGTSSNAPLHYAALAKTFLKPFPPKYAVVVFFANDNIDERLSIFRRIYFEADAEYFDKTSYINGKPTKVSKNLEELYKEATVLGGKELSAKNKVGNLFQFIGKAITTHASLPIIRNIIKPGSNFPYSTKLAIDTLIEQCREVGCKPVFVYIPTSKYWRPDSRSYEYVANIHKYIDGLKDKVSFVDLSDEFEPLGVSAYSPAGPHLSILGNKLVSEALENAIKSSPENPEK
jgi:hypothetical protein